MKRMFLVFTNIKTRRGKGLDFKIDIEEKMRLGRISKKIAALVPDLGRILVLGEYANYSLGVGAFLADDVFGCDFEGFVRVHGFIDTLNHYDKAEPDTVVVSCLSMYDSEPSVNEEHFGEQFIRRWNNYCLLFGMPPIPPHEKDGENAALFIDYETHKVRWISDIGAKTEETTENIST